MKKRKPLNILFIGNSHTYYNDMPLMVQRRAIECGCDCRVTMIAHGGWFLAQHAEEPDVRFNILYGGYDYVVLQEHAHPFGPVEKFRDAAVRLNRWIREAGSTPVIYDIWAKKSEPEKQEEMKTGAGDWLRSYRYFSMTEIVDEYSKRDSIILWSTDYFRIRCTWRQLMEYFNTYNDKGKYQFFKSNIKMDNMTNQVVVMLQEWKTSKKKIAFLQACPYNEQ